MQTVLTIAGFDPSSGAGITADLMVFAAHGLFGTSCVTNLTVQSTVGVAATHTVASDIVRATLECLNSDLPPAGIKIGMLSSEAIVVAVANFLACLRTDGHAIPVVLDPVLRSSSGRELLDPAGLALLQSRLIPLVDWITPNLDELGILTGQAIQSRADLVPASQILQKLGDSLNIVATGGHLDPPDDLLLTASGETHWLPGEHIRSNSTHGTGCALSSALLCELVLGQQPQAAALAAKQYVAEAIRSATPIGSGNGPLNHLWPLRPNRSR
jgi:hydroxymethylpyrimidine/phosphomethylpyrimidine kinase